MVTRSTIAPVVASVMPNSISKGVPKGKSMAGHYGVDRVTVQKLEIVKLDTVRNLVYLRGAVPGHNNGYLLLNKSTKVKR